MTTLCYLDPGEKGKHVDESRYRCICYSVFVCAIFQDNPKESHLVVVNVGQVASITEEGAN